MYYVLLAACAVIGYLLGSIPFSLIISKAVFHFDIREYGSHNMGGTNSGRVMGKKWGALVCFLDGAKTFIPVLTLSLLFKFNVFKFEDYQYIIYITGFAGLIGHCYPIFAKFKGGKAVACSYGFALATNIWLFLAGMAVFFLVLYIKKYVSLSSMISVFSMAMLSLIPVIRDHMNLIQWNLGYSVTLIIIFCFVVYRHSSNIKKLINHVENKVTWL